MKTKESEFFNKQSDITALKIEIYRKYLKVYLPKILMKYGGCLIADLFCGPGKNGDKDGSPIILLDAAREMLENNKLKETHKDSSIDIIFSDSKKQYAIDLKKLINQRTYPDNIKIKGPYPYEFNKVFEKIVTKYESSKIPKFFFLDPFGYSSISIDNIKTLIDLEKSELLLFVPTSHILRFAGSTNKIEGLERFLNNFISKDSNYKYKNNTEFNESIRERLLCYLDIKYVKAIELDGGSQQNALFFCTKHVLGMALMNEIVFKSSGNTSTIRIKPNEDKQLRLFKNYIDDGYKSFLSFLRSYIEKHKSVSNKDIINITAQKGFTKKHSEEALKDMKKNGIISVSYCCEEHKKGFYVAKGRWNKPLVTIKYEGE